MYFNPDAPENRFRDPALEYPELKELLYCWDQYSDTFVGAVSNLSAEELVKPMLFQMPIEGNALRDFYTFLAVHEMYHIGQMSILRRTLGYAAMAFIKQPG